jgi:putative transferase (TIGR04331 family)
MTLEDWHLETAASAGEIYKDLIGDSRQLFSTGGCESFSIRKTEILVGDLALLIARRLARSTKQVRILGDSYVVDPSTINQYLSMKLPTPLRTKDSYALLMSAEIDNFIDHLAICQYFGVESTIAVLMSHVAEVSDSDKTVSKSPAKRRAYLLVQKWLSKKSSQNSISISATYVGRGKEVLLSLLLGQTPSLLEVRPDIEPGHELLIRELLLREPLSIRDIALFLMKLLVPWSLKEDYSRTSARAYSLGFAKNPSVIFTSNSYSSDDEFKTHLANSISTATYIVGQHGNNFGVSLRTKVIPELNSSDLFLSWGWGGGVRGVHPFGQLKPAVKGKLPKRIKGVTLFLRSDFDYFLEADLYEPNSHYVEHILNLCNALDDLEITIHLRFHSSTTEFTRQYLTEGIANMPFATIAQNSPSIRKLLASGMGIVFGYDSTGMLEMGTAGIPFFLFAPNGLGLVRQQFRPNYESLRAAGLLSEEPSQAAQLISTWMSASREERKTQRSAIQKFTMGIAHNPKNKIRALRKILKNADEYVAHTRLEGRVEKY